jgi:hypothetical protein
MPNYTSLMTALKYRCIATVPVAMALIMVMANREYAQNAKTEKSFVPSSATQRNFRTFLPKADEQVDEPPSQLVQILLDRQEQGDLESYMIQVLFHGPPSQRSVKLLEDRIIIDFFDTGKPAIRLSKIRGGAIEANSLEELYYKDTNAKGAKTEKNASKPIVRIKKLVRLTLFIHQKVGDLKFRDTLDRTLIHFHLPKS